MEKLYEIYYVDADGFTHADLVRASSEEAARAQAQCPVGDVEVVDPLRGA